MTLRIGIVGAGAITERAHLPAVLASPGVELTALCDPDAARVRYLERQFGLSGVACADFHDAVGRVNAVILAVPNHLHARIGVELLDRGVHVLCEKPLATTSADAERLCDAARRGGAVLAVGFVTRFLPSTALTKQLIETGLLGPVEAFDFQYGTAGGWAPFSAYNLERGRSGGGVLVVSGSHFLDRLLYLFDDVRVTSHEDDGRGGVEANSVTGFSAVSRGRRLTGRVTLSKTHPLANRLRVVGERGALEVTDAQTRSVTFIPAAGGLRHEISAGPLSGPEPSYFRLQLEDFVHAVETGAPPRVDGRQGAASVALTEACYALRRPIEEPWCDATLDRLAALVPGAAA